MDRKEMIESLDQRDQILFAMLMHANEETLLQMFADGYTLSVTALEILYLRGFPSCFIRECIQKTKYYTGGEKIYRWLCAYLGWQAAEDFILSQCDFDDEFLGLLSDASLERYKRQEILKLKKARAIE